MRLLHASRRKFEEFIVDGEIPTYAILSHTWGKEEISFQDWRDIPLDQLRLRKGYKKISYCCRQALRDNIEWVWIDTCCIDKTSSAELSEAINSMFRWYRDSRICYAYLSDVPRDAPLTLDSEFSKSRWHTRGWTLQELIAPADLRFYSKDWHFLGTKSELSPIIESITHIEPKFLDSKNLDLASVAKRMSWASNRNTSRVEDIAYCLLGIFDINMPLIYGEGKKAFRRLQEEIIKVRFDDHSIFAWGTVVPRPSIEITDEAVLWGTKNIPWSEPKPLLGLLAESPKDFAFSGKFVPLPIAKVFYRQTSQAVAPIPVLAGSEIRIQLPIACEIGTVYYWNRPRASQIRPGLVVVLLCSKEEYRGWLRIPIQTSGHNTFGRTKELIYDDKYWICSLNELLYENTRLVHMAPEQRREFGRGDIIIQRNIVGGSHEWAGTASLNHCVTYLEGEQLVVVNGQVYGRLFASCYELKAIGEDYGFLLSFSRYREYGTMADGALSVGLTPIYSPKLLDSRGPLQEPRSYKGIEWQDPRLMPEPMCSHIMATPSDGWELEAEPFPAVLVGAQRKYISEDVFVDIINILIYDKPDDIGS